ncbi:SDR family oxidoreductase, partial [Candidatus Pelagibacter sp.]|nr:SDR family oxidoreductase [Candidatus Pelagibacter sp.]
DKSKDFDLSKQDLVSNFLKKNKNLNYIINASGKNDHVTKNKKTIFENDKILIDYIYQNVIAPKNLIEQSVTICKQIKSIINFASLYGVKSPYHPMYKKRKSLSYCISKHAMEGLTKYYAALYAKKNIRINNIRVGGVKNHQPDDFKNNFLKRTPNKKMLNKNDVAYLVDFLCSEKSKNIIGENINLEGGYNLW